MRIEPFGVEQWMNAWETRCTWNLAETCVDSLTVAGLLALTGTAPDALDALLPLRLGYGAIEGSEPLRAAIAALYATRTPGEVLVTHGAVGANQLVHRTLVEPGDRVVALLPTYQQHWSIPESIGAEVRILRLRAEDGFLPDLDELRRLTAGGVRLIAFSNPNNPTGSLMDRPMLEAIAGIAAEAGAWVLADEVYRGLDQDDPGTTASMADLYERGIGVGSMSKAFSLAGLRLGWIIGPRELIDVVAVQRDYDTISVGMLDDHLATLALEHADAVLARSRRIVRANLGALDAWVGAAPGVSWVRPRSGTTALLALEGVTPTRELCVELVRETGVMLTPGSAMAMEGHVRIGYANDAAVLREGLARLGPFLAARRA